MAVLLAKAGHVVLLPDSFGSSPWVAMRHQEREVTASGLRREDAIDAAQWLAARPAPRPAVWHLSDGRTAAAPC
jgi:dienelactone hydrolase